MFEVKVFQGDREFLKVLRLGVVIVHTDVTVSIKRAKIYLEDNYNCGHKVSHHHCNLFTQVIVKIGATL